jgi:hypothetical protein
MQRMPKLLSSLAAGAATLLLVAPAAAGTARTYQGAFVGDVQYVNCSATPSAEAASGRWVVVVRGDSLLATFNILVNGKHHVAFAATASNAPVGDETFAGEIETQAGTLRISLTGSAFRYAIPGYTSPWDPDFQCASVTYSGVLTTPRGN